jgi:hypothetical protein
VAVAVPGNANMSGHYAALPRPSVAAISVLSGPVGLARSRSNDSGTPAASSRIGWSRQSSGRRVFSMSQWFGRTGQALHLQLEETRLLPSYDSQYTRREVVQR